MELLDGLDRAGLEEQRAKADRLIADREREARTAEEARRQTEEEARLAAERADAAQTAARAATNRLREAERFAEIVEFALWRRQREEEAVEQERSEPGVRKRRPPGPKGHREDIRALLDGRRDETWTVDELVEALRADGNELSRDAVRTTVSRMASKYGEAVRVEPGKYASVLGKYGFLMQARASDEGAPWTRGRRRHRSI